METAADPFETAALDITFSDLLIATPDRSDPLIDRSVAQVLKLLRDQHRMEAAFVGEVVDGNRIRRGSMPAAPVHFADDDDTDPLELAFCKQAIRTHLPVSCYLSAPIVLHDGGVYGKLYSFSHNADREAKDQDLKKLAMTAQLAARLITERLRAARPATH